MPNNLCFNEMLGTPPLVVPKNAVFSEQTYDYVAFVPVFGRISEQVTIRVRSAEKRPMVDDYTARFY